MKIPIKLSEGHFAIAFFYDEKQERLKVYLLKS